MKKLLVFASGSETGGGSGFENLVEAFRCDGTIGIEVVGVVSNHENGGVRKRADKLGIKFYHFPSPATAESYQFIAAHSGAEFFALSGWLKLVKGLDPATKFNSKTVFNIHPGPLPEFGGKGMYGHHVHEAVMASYERGETSYSAVTMHFVTEEYDKGPKFLEKEIPIYSHDTSETLAERVNIAEHLYQPLFTEFVVNGLIYWDGENPESLVIPNFNDLNTVG